MFIRWIKIFSSSMHSKIYLACIFILFPNETRRFESDDWNRLYLIKSLLIDSNVLSFSLSLHARTTSAGEFIQMPINSEG